MAPTMLDYSLALVTPPANLPVTLAEAKKQCEIASSDSAHDGHVASLIRAATSLVQRDSQRKLLCQVWEQRLNAWPGTEYIPLRLGPILSIVSIKYIDNDGNEQTWASSNYAVETSRSRQGVWLVYGGDWPSGSTRVINDAIKIRAVCGYGDSFTADANTDAMTPTYGAYSLGEAIQLSNYGGALPAGLTVRRPYYVVTAGTTIQVAASPSGAAIDITDAGTGTHYIDRPPEEAKQAILMLVAHWFENREAILVGSNQTEYTFAYRSLVNAISPGWYP